VDPLVVRCADERLDVPAKRDRVLGAHVGVERLPVLVDLDELEVVLSDASSARLDVVVRARLIGLSTRAFIARERALVTRPRSCVDDRGLGLGVPRRARTKAIPGA
jgi:hypothetical protein